MSIMTFDTMKACEELEAAGFDRTQAASLVKVQRQAFEDFEQTRELATKKDILQLEVKMADMKAELIRWVVGSNLALAAFLVAVMAWMK